MKKMNKPFLCYTLDLANYLVRCGFDMRKIEDNDTDPTGRLKVILFESSDELHQAVRDYVAKRN